ncbi:hypothetical protein M231_04874 [Tremella mesenterica]|uniref:Actin cytoskeleton-regulatory complex protein SLA1 n=1 Tax=Tremella mesenterica TaxID=5217 RepID=A0A4Q1BJP0_TREME|nr:hypothetical protein M231_04874 [Tremella mesenterica]
MAYVAVAKALYDYTAQDPETELSLKEDQIVYIIEKEDNDWWKAKLKETDGNQGAIGLIPQTYVEEIPVLHTTRAIYAYESTSPEELSLDEDAVLHVYSIEDDWLLVRIDGASPKLGFVPRTYCEPFDEASQVDVEDAAQAAAEVEAARQNEAEAAKQREVAERQRQLKLKDKVETWSISEMDGKKKKKGTLGVGNGAVFFASDTDKLSPVKQLSITDLAHVSQPSSKNLELTFSTLSEPLLFHCGSSDAAKAIVAKLEASKAAAGEALQMIEAESHVEASDEEPEHPVTEAKAVRFATEPSAQAPAANGHGEAATVLYDFDAQGEDELSVHENEFVTVVDKENDEWWVVRNQAGHEGVVPAQYVQIGDGPAATGAETDTEDEEEEGRRQEEAAAAAAAALEAERREAAQRQAEQRLAIEKAAREKQRQEEEDRQLALQMEAKQREKQEKRERRRQEELQRQQEEEAERRREAARRLEPPKIAKRPSAQNVAAAAANLPSRGRGAPERPPDNNRPKPNPGRVRVWNDKTGQFKVEAEYLGMNGAKVRLHKTNGVIIEVPVEKMSNEDTQLIKRHEARKARAKAEILDDDDVPLAKSPNRPPSQPIRPTQSRARVEEPIPPEAMVMPPPRKKQYDWFEFFLNAGCDIDDCTRYATNFERDRIDEALLPDLESSTLRSLGLKEGDVIRVKKAISNMFKEKTPQQLEQVKIDEEYARQLQEHENSGAKGPVPQPPPGLFTGPGGKLANNTRRGRPEKKSTGPDSVDASALASISDQLIKTSISPPPSVPPVTVSPPPAPSIQPTKPPKPTIGFDDDAWTIKPSSSKPASPAPPPTTISTSASTSNGTESLLAQIQALRPASTGVSANNTGNSQFDRLAQLRAQPQQASPLPQPVQQFQNVQQPPQVQPQFQQPNQSFQPQFQQLSPAQTGIQGGYTPSPYGLGVQNTGQPMSNLLGARGPVAPVPANQGLLNPMQPQQTGMFVPTRPGQNGLMPQPTGFQQGFQQTYGGPSQQLQLQPQSIQPNFTGYPGNFNQQSQQSSFNVIASIPPPQQPQNPDKFAPSNIFAAMKKTDFGRPEDERPQSSNKYDALRPLTTGYNGAPGFPVLPQQTGLMPQQTGFGVLSQPTGFQGQQFYQNPYGYR